MDFGHREEHVDNEMILVQTNLDDMNPEWGPRVADLLFEAGANDVYWVPIYMKKGRPAYMLNVLISKVKLEEVKRILFTETTTLGIRWLEAGVHRLGREFRKVDTPWGPVTIKVGKSQGKTVQFAPEFADCEGIAKRHGIPLKDVYDQARLAYLRQIPQA